MAAAELAVGSAELLEKQVAEFHIGCADVDGVHEFFNVVVHGLTSIRSFQRALKGTCAVRLREKHSPVVGCRF